MICIQERVIFIIDESDKNNKEKIVSIFKKGILIIPILDFNLNIIDVINYIEFID